MANGSFNVQLVEGQTYTNRFRLKMWGLMQEQGLSIRKGLDSMGFRQCYNFLGGKSDIPMDRARQVAEELGSTLEDMISM